MEINFYQYLVLTDTELLVVFVTDRRVAHVEVVYGDREKLLYYQTCYQGTLLSHSLELWNGMGWVVEKCKM